MDKETNISVAKDQELFKIMRDRIKLSTDVYQSYRIYDVVRHLVSKSNLITSQINCTGLRAGVYIIQLIKKTGESQTIKFVKP